MVTSLAKVWWQAMGMEGEPEMLEFWVWRARRRQLVEGGVSGDEEEDASGSGGVFSSDQFDSWEELEHKLNFEYN